MRDTWPLLRDSDNFGVAFNQLFVLANMPIQRYGSWLLSKGHFAAYMGTLRAAHRDDNLDGVMCRSLLGVDYLGYRYDCDFNQMLHLPPGALEVAVAGTSRPTCATCSTASCRARSPPRSTVTAVSPVRGPAAAARCIERGSNNPRHSRVGRNDEQ